MIVLNDGRPITDFPALFKNLRDQLLESPPINIGEWQSQKIDNPMRELLHVAFEYRLPVTPEMLAKETGARMPWAEDHFLERVGGEPLNPSPSEKWWPFRQNKHDEGASNADHKSEGEAFSHTYPERMWPKFANPDYMLETDRYENNQGRMGIRFDYGDLQDVVNQLFKSPMTRQAYLPIWFPEDTGAVHGKRVPCTLGYHFIIRDGKLDISYFMRSTDLLRHFQDDIYLAGRLAQWVVNELNRKWDADAWDEYHETGASSHREEDTLQVGNLIFHTANLHIFEGDVDIFKFWKGQGKTWY